MSENYDILCHEGDPEWHELRREGIGGSDAPAIMGLTSWGSPTSVQAEKWGLGEEREESELFEWGHLLEGPMLERLSHETDLRFVQYGYLLRSNEYQWAQCTPDGLATGDFGTSWAQCKNTIRADEWEDGVPERVWVQLQHEMLVTGAEEEYIAVLMFGNRFGYRCVPRDQTYLDETHIPRCEEFWAATKEGVPVELDGSAATKRVLARLHPEDNGETVALDESFLDLKHDLAAAKKCIKADTEEVTRIENQIRAMLGDATYGVMPDGAGWSLKTQTRKSHEVKESTFRVLRATNPKSE